MKPTDIIHPSWNPILGELNLEPILKLNYEILPNSVYHPKKEQIFRVFQKPLQDIKVVILGQDPYPTPGNANGLAFAVNKNCNMPVSLRNIAKELANNYSLSLPFAGDWKTLEHWENQGVFLLNTALTVESGNAGSHLKYWENFTKRVIWYISSFNPCIWLLWGKKAQSFSLNMPKSKKFEVKNYSRETITQIPINDDWNYILSAAHPAAEAYSKDAGFFGCNHFYFVNKILEQKAQQTINW